MDVAILTAWQELQESLCDKCGRPLAVHGSQVPADYTADYRECPSVLALDRAQAKRSIEDEAAREKARKDGRDIEARLNPERARSWLTWTAEEGEPQF